MNENCQRAISALYAAIEKLPHAGMHNECCGEIFTQLALLLESSNPAVVVALRQMSCKTKDKLIVEMLRAVANAVLLKSVPHNHHL